MMKLRQSVQLSIATYDLMQVSTCIVTTKEEIYIYIYIDLIQRVYISIFIYRGFHTVLFHKRYDCD